MSDSNYIPKHPYGPRFLKGALVSVDIATSQRKTITFQYNPESLNRSLQPQVVGGESGQQSQAVRFIGAPVETIEMEVIVDATDQLERDEPTAVQSGIQPQLTALELLLYPDSGQVIRNQALLDQGCIEIGSYIAPLTLLMWGKNRILPVSVTRCSIREELFDTKLNPLRATVSLGLRALSYSDLDPSHQGYHLFLAYQQAKEAMASYTQAGAAGSIT